MKPVDYSKLNRRRCSVCKRMRVVRFFYRFKDKSAPINGWRYGSRCRDCSREQCRQYGQGNKEARNARLRRWRERNPSAAREKDRRARYRSKYGLTLEQVAALKDRYDGRCWICRDKQAKCIDHDHDTGEVRGALCPSCKYISWSG